MANISALMLCCQRTRDDALAIQPINADPEIEKKTFMR
jgi:hypothetical protein